MIFNQDNDKSAEELKEIYVKLQLEINTRVAKLHEILLKHSTEFNKNVESQFCASSYISDLILINTNLNKTLGEFLDTNEVLELMGCKPLLIKGYND